MSLNVAILIPSYKRPEVLSKTLWGLFGNIQADTLQENFNVGVFVGLNEARDEDTEVARSFLDVAGSCNVLYAFDAYEKNLGKAKALNLLFDKYCKESSYDYVVTMDNDMVINRPWLYLIDVAGSKDYDLMGFSSSLFWAHLPKREECPFEETGGFKFYQPYNGIAGGMMLFHKKTLEEHKWTNKGGVYGFDDAQMCLDLKKKYVLHKEGDWLEHDPMQSSTPELKHYHDRKQDFFNKGQYILPEGWDK